MHLTLSTTHYPATDLGFLLQKNPARVQAFEALSAANHFARSTNASSAYSLWKANRLTRVFKRRSATN